MRALAEAGLRYLSHNGGSNFYCHSGEEGDGGVRGVVFVFWVVCFGNFAVELSLFGACFGQEAVDETRLLLST